MTRPDEPYSLLQVSLLRTVPLSLLKLCESDGPVAVDLLPSLLFAVATDTLGTTVRSFIQVCIFHFIITYLIPDRFFIGPAQIETVIWALEKACLYFFIPLSRIPSKFMVHR